VAFLAGAVGKVTFVERGPWETAIYSFDLGNPAGKSASPSIPRPDETSIIPGRQEAASAYAKAVASAPEASKVAGVSERPVTADEYRVADGFGWHHGPIAKPERGRSYPITLIYTPASDAPAISVLAITTKEVTAGRCPRAFRVRSAHTYLITCQVTFRPGAEGMGTYKVTRPQGVESTGLSLSMR
jgi:hypothetical protein